MKLSTMAGSMEVLRREGAAKRRRQRLHILCREDHGRWIEKLGIKRGLVRWIFGKPLIAFTMIRHDYSADLFVSVELLLAEADDRAGCTVTNVVPSSLIAVGENPELLVTAQALDARVEPLVTSAVS